MERGFIYHPNTYHLDMARVTRPQHLARVTVPTMELARKLHALWVALGNRRKLDTLYRSMLRRELRRLERECKRRGIDPASPAPQTPTTKPNRRPPRRYS